MKNLQSTFIPCIIPDADNLVSEAQGLFNRHEFGNIVLHGRRREPRVAGDTVRLPFSAYDAGNEVPMVFMVRFAGAGAYITVYSVANVLREVTEASEQIVDGLAGFAMRGALNEAKTHWRDHLSQGEAPSVILDDLGELADVISALRSNLLERGFAS